MKAVKELLKAKQDIPTKLRDPIPDPKAIWKARQEEIKIQEALLQQQRQEEDDSKVTFIVNTVSNQSLCYQEEDYILIPPIMDNNNDSDSDSNNTNTLVLDELGVYDSNIDYSWNRRR